MWMRRATEDTRVVTTYVFGDACSEECFDFAATEFMDVAACMAVVRARGLDSRCHCGTSFAFWLMLTGYEHAGAAEVAGDVAAIAKFGDPAAGGPSYSDNMRVSRSKGTYVLR